MSDPVRKQEYYEEAQRLALLPKEDQRQIIALHRSTAENPKAPKREREDYCVEEVRPGTLPSKVLQHQPRRPTMRFLLAILALFLSLAPARAVFVLDFDGLKEGERPERYYSGGYGSLGSGPGPDYGAGVDGIVQIRGIENEPSPPAVIWATRSISVSAGFDTGFCFYHSQGGGDPDPSWLEVWDRDHMMFRSELFPTGDFTKRWLLLSFPFAGEAYSIRFKGRIDLQLMDDFTIGSATPIPEPGTALLLVSSARVLVGYGWKKTTKGRRRPS